MGLHAVKNTAKTPLSAKRNRPLADSRVADLCNRLHASNHGADNLVRGQLLDHVADNLDGRRRRGQLGMIWGLSLFAGLRFGCGIDVDGMMAYFCRLIAFRFGAGGETDGMTPT